MAKNKPAPKPAPAPAPAPAAPRVAPPPPPPPRPATTTAPGTTVSNPSSGGYVPPPQPARYANTNDRAIQNMALAQAAANAGNWAAAQAYMNNATQASNATGASSNVFNATEQHKAQLGQQYTAGLESQRPQPGGGEDPGGGSDPGGGDDTTVAVETPEQAALRRLRQSAYDELIANLRFYGIDVDGSGLASQIWGWVQGDRSSAAIMTDIRKTQAYATRFPGMAALVKQGQAMSEAEYIAQERAYRSVLQQWSLPAGFYDDPTDFGKFIANGVSVKEVDDRVRTAKTFLDEQAPSAYKAALRSAGVEESGMLAYVLDGEKAQSVITKQMKNVAVAGSANQYGFNLTADQAAPYGATLGQQYDTIGVDQRMALEKTMAQIGLQAEQDTRLSFIENEAFNRTDALDAALLNDTQKQLASQRRARREQARFSGTSATTATTLTRNRGV